MSKKYLIFLGTSSSIPQPKKFTQSLAICSFNECVLLDVGEGSQIRLMAAGIDHRNIKVLAVTHVHGDHIHGMLPFIESTIMKVSSQGGREGDRYSLQVIAPATICKYLSTATQILGIDKALSNIVISCIEAGGLYLKRVYIETPSKEIAILPLPVKHGIDEAYGYLVKIRTRKGDIGIFYSGDGLCTNDCRELLAQLKPSIIVHETTFLDYSRDKAKAGESLHATVFDAAALAEDVGARVLVLTHISARYGQDDRRDFISRSRRYFRGDVIIAEDLAKIPLDL